MEKYKKPECGFPGCKRDGIMLVCEASKEPKFDAVFYCEEHFDHMNGLIEAFISQEEVELVYSVSDYNAQMKKIQDNLRERKVKEFLRSFSRDNYGGKYEEEGKKPN